MARNKRGYGNDTKPQPKGGSNEGARRGHRDNSPQSQGGCEGQARGIVIQVEERSGMENAMGGRVEARQGKTSEALSQ